VESATEWPIVSAPSDYDDGEFGGMKIGKGNLSTRRKPASAPLCPPQIPLDQTRVWTRAAAVGGQRLTAWAMAWPCSVVPNQLRYRVPPTLTWYILLFLSFLSLSISIRNSCFAQLHAENLSPTFLQNRDGNQSLWNIGCHLYLDTVFCLFTHDESNCLPSHQKSKDIYVRLRLHHA
jgi:hypothetical protein